VLIGACDRTHPFDRRAFGILQAQSAHYRVSRCVVASVNKLHRLGDDVDDSVWLSDQWRMVDTMCPYHGAHPVGHEGLGGWIDHPVLVGMQIPASVA